MAAMILSRWRSNSNRVFGAARGREAAAGEPSAVEVVQDVEAATCRLPPTSSGAAVRGFVVERDRADRLDPVHAEPEVEDAGEARQGVADAQGVDGRQPALGVDGRVDVLLVVAVVEQDPAAVVQVLQRDRRRRRASTTFVGLSSRPPTDSDTSPKRPRVKISVTVSSLVEVDAHALVRLQVVDRRRPAGSRSPASRSAAGRADERAA